MPTLNELLGNKDRGDGRRFRRNVWPANRWFEPIFKDKSGKVNGLDNCRDYDYWESHEPDDWQEYKEPPKTKKVKLYKPVYRGYEDHYRSKPTHEWHTDKENWADKDIVGWLEQEVEVVG